MASVVLRALGAVLLVPLLADLFGDTPSDAWAWVGLLILVTLAGWCVDWLVARLSFELGFGLLETAQHTVADRIAQTQLGWFGAENTVTARSAIAATGPDLVGLVIYLVTPILTAILLPIAIAVALIPIAWQLGLAALAGVPFLLGAYWASGRCSRSADRAAESANNALTERIVEFARTQHTLRAARRVEPERSHVGAALQSQHGAATRVLLMQIPGQVVFSIASQIALILLAGTTVWLAHDDIVTVPQAVGLIIVLVRYLEPFTALAELSAGVETTTLSLRRIKQVIQAPQIATGTARISTDRPPRLTLRDVSFGYAANEPAVLHHLDLVFEPGSTTAIVGPSGSGKSTLLSLLAGLREPSEGSVLVDELAVNQLDADRRRELVSMVFQHPYLFDGSLRENVVVGDPTATEARLANAAELARVDMIVEHRAEGWDARVGEGGSTLSGGERQRVSIARALLKPAPLLLFDEATSALDNENAQAITSALVEDPLPRTRVIIAHNLSTIRTADRVIFLEDGKVAEDGTIDELMAAGGRFAEFWRQQDAAASWRLSGSQSDDDTADKPPARKDHRSPYPLV